MLVYATKRFDIRFSLLMVCTQFFVYKNITVHQKTCLLYIYIYFFFMIETKSLRAQLTIRCRFLSFIYLFFTTSGFIVQGSADLPGSGIVNVRFKQISTAFVSRKFMIMADKCFFSFIYEYFSSNNKCLVVVVHLFDVCCGVLIF